MTNEQERLAREWAESKLAMPTGHLDADVIAAAEHIMATTKEPTMDGVEWNDEKHYLAGATSEIDGSERVMIAPLDGAIVNARPRADRVSLASPDALTPNGKKYRLVEVTGDEHPETLTTEEDYRIATVGTIVAYADGHAWTKTASGAWRQGKDRRTNREMAGTERLVLRWGWGK